MMANPPDDDQLLWQPSQEDMEQANVTQYWHWLEHERALSFLSREQLWQWSVAHLEDFWSSLWDYFHVMSSQSYHSVLTTHTMPSADWFPGAYLNYAEHIFRQATDQRPALLFRSERHPTREIPWSGLAAQVGALVASLRARGIKRGDRVVAFLPVMPETVAAFLACASLGVVWSSCSPDFGLRSVIDRFQQIEPVLLFAVDGYQYAGKQFDRLPLLAEIQQALPSLRHTILIPYLDATVQPDRLEHCVLWHDMIREPAPLVFEPVPFSHPLWILYSSGTTGLPKAIVQGHGGILLEHLKALTFDIDLKPGDRFFWYTTTGWMMWNFLQSGLLVGATLLLYDGSPAFPDHNFLWQFAHDAGMTFFGTSASFIASCQKAQIEPARSFDFARLRGLGSTGSPLSPEGFRWLHDHVKPDLWVASISGGTDVCSAFVTGSPLLPVYAGELQCRSLGASVEAFDDQGKPLIGEVGELVITKPLPSMPLFFWNDPENSRYLDSYFSVYPGVWRHGDWIQITARGSAIIYGRSDSTINRMGIRMGSSEIYRVVESLPEILDSLIVGVELPHGGYYLPLFVVLAPSVPLDDALKQKIKQNLRLLISPHHVPDDIIVVSEVPRTLSGKKLEVPVKKLLMGFPLAKIVNQGSLSNPRALQPFVEIATRLAVPYSSES